MSYGPKRILSVTSVAANTTYVIEDVFNFWNQKGVWQSANFFVQSANTTGDWDIELQWRPDQSAIGAIIATTVGATGITTDTITQIPFNANITGINEGIPFPTHIVLTEVSAGGIDVDLWVMFA